MNEESNEERYAKMIFERLEALGEVRNARKVYEDYLHRKKHKRRENAIR